MHVLFFFFFFFCSKLSFLFHLNNHHSKTENVTFWLKRPKPFAWRRTNQFCILQLPIFYCVSLVVVTITRHVFISLWEKFEHCCKAKISKSLKNVEKIGLGTFNGSRLAKWKRLFLTCPCNKIGRLEAVGLSFSKNYYAFLWICEIWGNFMKNWHLLITAWL